MSSRRSVSGKSLLKAAKISSSSKSLLGVLLRTLLIALLRACVGVVSLVGEVFLDGVMLVDTVPTLGLKLVKIF